MQIRRNKTDPCSDFWHTLLVGAVVFFVLVLPLAVVIQVLT